MKLYIRRNLGRGLPAYREGETVTLDNAKPDEKALAEQLIKAGLADAIPEPKAKSK